ncbi:MAG: NAD(P)/FAD-dependent oxidoreductase [Gemmatimonadetes bacterium]|nr:NAD(P)/FAD-dependent oxidoreductase [Gemmatimonadota bacterium]
MTRVTTEIVVVGAGPAGCVFATRMAQLGYDVVLIERARFPRSHVGESLSPGVMPMLALMGSAAIIEAVGFPRVSNVSTNWEGTEAVRHDPRAQGMLVERGAFDAALLARAHAVGVRVLQPAQVREHERTPNGWRLNVDVPAESMELHARFLADGTGRSARFGGRRRTMGPRTIAIHGYWTGTKLPDQPRIEAGEREWYWGVPIPDGSYNTLVFVDAERFRAEPGVPLDNRLRALLGESLLMRDTRGAILRAPARAADATPYVDDDCVSAHHIRVGDAALAIDPLSSSGVQKAIQSALAGAIVVNTLLRRPESTDAALTFYRESLQESAVRHRLWAGSHYATAAARFSDAFWHDRASNADVMAAAPSMMPAVAPIADDVPLQLSPMTVWDDVPCLGEQYVERKRALRHPLLDGPVAYVGGQELAPLLREMPSGLTALELAQVWSRAMPTSVGHSVARWLVGHGVLEPLTDVSGSIRPASTHT